MATIHDVAIATGVSDATVSRALRGMNSVRPSTRQLVLDAARRLDFTLSRSASSLASGKTMRVVMLFGCTIASWFNASCIEGALETLEPHGYDLVPVRVCDLEQLHGFFADLPSNGRNMDGFILPSFSLDDSESALLSSMHIPAVALDARSASRLPASVMLDNKRAMNDAVRFLRQLGHRRIGYVAHPKPAPFPASSYLRKDFFLDAMRECIPDAEPVAFASSSDMDAMSEDEAMAAIAGRIASSEHRPTAICVETDEASVAIMRHLRQLGIRIPEDLSIIGFDDHPTAVVAGLTTLHQDPQHMARLAAQQLLALMRGEQLSETVTTVRATLIPRATTAAAPSLP